MNLNGLQRKRLQTILVHVYPRWKDMDKLTRLALGTELRFCLPFTARPLFGGDDLINEATGHMIDWAIAKNRIADLITVVLADNPRDVELQALANELGIPLPESARAALSKSDPQLAEMRQLLTTVAQDIASLRADFAAQTAQLQEQLRQTQAELQRERTARESIGQEYWVFEV